MRQVYVFSGLGADERVFYKMNFGEYTITHIKWLSPQKNESIENYAGRLCQQIITARPILVGLSFGGMMAIEVAKHIETEKIILISSAKCKSEIPFYYRWAGKLKLTSVVPTKALININILTNQFISARSEADKKLLSQILRDTDPVFLKWAIEKITLWENQSIPPNCYHLHGNADRILPHKYLKSCNFTIDGGAHLMIVNNPLEVNEQVLLLLNK